MSEKGKDNYEDENDNDSELEDENEDLSHNVLKRKAANDANYEDLEDENDYDNESDSDACSFQSCRYYSFDGKKAYRTEEVKSMLNDYEESCLLEWKALVESGKSVNELNIELDSVNEAGHIDIGLKDIAIIGLEVNYASLDVDLNRTPLITAALEGQLRCVEYLLDSGADINAQDKYGMTALMYACLQECVHLCGYLDIVIKLLSRGADVSLKNIRGATALMCACQAEDDDGELSSASISLLLQQKANVNDVDNFGRSALMYLCAGFEVDNRVTCVNKLLSFDADVNLQDTFGDTALLLLLQMCPEDAEYDYNHDDEEEEGADETVVGVLEALLARGADVNLKNKEGESALYHCFLRIGNTNDGYRDDDEGSGTQADMLFIVPIPRVLQRLLEHGALVDEPLKDGKTALILLCEKENVVNRENYEEEEKEVLYKCIDLLLKHNADIYVKDNNNVYLLDNRLLTARTRKLLEATINEYRPIK